MLMTVPSKPLYALLALCIPFSLLCASLSIVAALFGLSFPLTGVLLLAFLAGIGATVYCELIKNTASARTSADLRGAAAVLILSYTLASISRPAAGIMMRFFPSVLTVTAALSALFVFLAVMALKKIFAARELFISYTDQYRGEALQQAMHDRADLLITYHSALARVGRLHAFHLCCLIILTTIKPVALPLLFFLALLLIGAAFIFGLFRTFNFEHYCAGQGIAVRAADRARRIAFIAFCALAASLMALLFTSRTNLLPVSILISIILWLLSLLPSLDFLPEDIQAQIQGSMYFPEQHALAPFEGEAIAQPWKGWEYLKFGFIAFAVVAFIWFMLKPLFARSLFAGGTAQSFAKKLCRALVHWVSACAQAFKDFFSLLKDRTFSPRVSDDTVNQAVLSLEQVYASARKKHLKGSLTLFARLIVWGTAWVPWKPSYAPAQYCALVAACVPEQAQAVMRCGVLFEQALYAARRLSVEEQALFRDLIDAITNA